MAVLWYVVCCCICLANNISRTFIWCHPLRHGSSLTLKLLHFYMVLPFRFNKNYTKMKNISVSFNINLVSGFDSWLAKLKLSLTIYWNDSIKSIKTCINYKKSVLCNWNKEKMFKIFDFLVIFRFLVSLRHGKVDVTSRRNLRQHKSIIIIDIYTHNYLLSCSSKLLDLCLTLLK